jgi:hypothetical protein
MGSAGAGISRGAIEWQLDEEKRYWRSFCQLRGMSEEEFELRWPVVSVAYRLALNDPQAPLEVVLSRYLEATAKSGLCEESRRRAFGRIWAKILARHHGEVRSGVIDARGA